VLVEDKVTLDNAFSPFVTTEASKETCCKAQMQVLHRKKMRCSWMLVFLNALGARGLKGLASLQVLSSKPKRETLPRVVHHKGEKSLRYTQRRWQGGTDPSSGGWCIE